MKNLGLEEFKRDYYLFDPIDFGRIFVFVDFSNVRHWAKSFWLEENKKYLKREIDIRKITDICEMIRPVRKFFYYGHYREHPDLPPENPFNIKYRQSIYRIDKARKAGFEVRTKPIKEIDDFDDEGKFLGRKHKCNFDIEMTMDILLRIEKYDSIFLWSGDSDFHYLLKHLQAKKRKIVTICARDFASDELRTHSDKFIPADPLRDLLEYLPHKNSTPGVSREA